MGKPKVIIIGAGIGGLSVAAYLSKLGISSLLMERSDVLGGRCSTRVINGKRFEIGALYVGGGAFERLRNTFGLQIESKRVHCGVKINDSFVYFPVGVKTLIGLKKCGASWTEIARFCMNSGKISNQSKKYYENKSIGEIFDEAISSKTIRLFFAAMAGVSGISPYDLPGRFLAKDVERILNYKSQNPEYLPEGNGEIGARLWGIAEKNSTILFNHNVKRIIVEKERAVGVETNAGEFYADVIISNAGIKPTILEMTPSKAWPEEVFKAAKRAKESLRVVNIFFTFSNSFSIPRDRKVFLMPFDVKEEFEALEQGKFPRQSMFIVHIIHDSGHEDAKESRGTIQFYYPRGEVSDEDVRMQVQKIMEAGIDRLFDDFSNAITNYSVYDPKTYERAFGIAPKVFGIAPDRDYKPFPIRTALNKLYCVGDSVEPEGPCVPQAMESGIECGKMIEKELN